MQVDPEFGFFAKSYLLLAQGDTARFNKSDLLLLAPENDKAIRYYEEFSGRLDEIQASREDFDPEELEDIEDTMRALLESRMSTKH